MNHGRAFYWSVRRELWENRWLYLAPLMATGLAILAFLTTLAALPGTVQAVSGLSSADQARTLSRPFDMAAVAIIGVMILTCGFYCTIALHNERRDRSLLFWKSLPVPDATAVLAKISLPLIFLPLFIACLIFVMQLVLLIIATLVLWMAGLDGALLWTHLTPLSHAIILPYGLLTMSIWYAPLYAWCLFVSAWARWVPAAWAVGIALIPYGFERIATESQQVQTFCLDRLSGSYGRAFTSIGHTGKTELAELDPVKFLTSPDMWAGLALAALFIAAAIWCRRYCEPD